MQLFFQSKWCPQELKWMFVQSTGGLLSYLGCDLFKRNHDEVRNKCACTWREGWNENCKSLVRWRIVLDTQFTFFLFSFLPPSFLILSFSLPPSFPPFKFVLPSAHITDYKYGLGVSWGLRKNWQQLMVFTERLAHFSCLKLDLTVSVRRGNWIPFALFSVIIFSLNSIVR